MVTRNTALERLSPNYLFREVQLRKEAFLRDHPVTSLTDLGIGNTTMPLPLVVAEALAEEAFAFGFECGYLGYGPELGEEALCNAIANQYYNGLVQSGDITISDGAKGALSLIQTLFGPTVRIGVQDPSYPVFIEGSLLHGVRDIALFPCTPENGFFPDLESHPPVDLLYICSPNNPTGVCYTHDQLSQLVDYAKTHRALIIFDAAYAAFIRDDSLPRSIYDVPGGSDVAIEVGSFSKMSGFTGLRLGWTVVPETLCYDDGSPIALDWRRVVTTLFNGASRLIQRGGLSALEEGGYIEPYLESTRLLREQFGEYEQYGGEHAPYIWVKMEGRSSWDIFDTLLRERHIVSTPGSGFGPSGESFVRLSAFNPLLLPN